MSRLATLDIDSTRIDVRGSRVGDMVSLRVENEGFGLPRDALDTIFEPFTGVDAVSGDAAHADTLASARLGGAGSLIVSVAGVSGVEESLRAAREVNPSIQILARATHLREVPRLRAAGADVVVSGEGEVALALTAAILERLGASAEQIDRERSRVRDELG
jgi:voltage-gated potassium channel Kch